MIKTIYTLFLAVLLIPGYLLAQEDQLLPAERAFVLDAQIDANNHLQLNWKIEQGYYLYKKSFSVLINGQQFSSTALAMPPGNLKQDPLFGQVEIYKKALNASLDQLPVTGQALDIQVNSQGCHEPLGVCYPPQTRKFTLIASAQAAESLAVEAPISKTGIFTDGSVFSPVPQDEFLPVDEAFQLVVTATDDTRIIAHFESADGYYLYRPHILFKSNTTGINLSSVVYPQGQQKDDPHFGEIEVYYGIKDIVIELRRSSIQQDFNLSVSYQGCAEDGICYPPQSNDIPLTLAAYTPEPELDYVAQSTIDKSLFWYLLAAFGAGLLLTFTPCVLPMIPILSGIIMSEKEGLPKGHAGTLSIIYVLGTAASYSLIGAVAGATGEQLQAYFQTPWAISGLSLLLFLMALSMFGLFKLQVPSVIQSHLHGHGDKVSGGGIIATFILGMLSALIVGACVSPLLISTLSLAIAKGSAVLGAGLMFSMAMGMGVVLIAIGFGLGYKLPKVGIWMKQINIAIGVMLLGVAIYLLGFIPQVPVLFLWSMLFIGSSVYLFLMAYNLTSQFKLMAKIPAIICLTWGMLALLGGFYGVRDITQPLPLKQWSTTHSANDASIINTKMSLLTSNKQIDELILKAKALNKTLLLDYYADWCLDCLRMDKSTYKDSEVVSMINENFIMGKVDITDASSDEIKAIKHRFNVYGPPATLFFSPIGDELKDHRFYGYRNSFDFLQTLQAVLN